MQQAIEYYQQIKNLQLQGVPIHWEVVAERIITLLSQPAPAPVPAPES